MEPRHHDPAGHIDHDAIKARAAMLRQQAIDALWSDLFRRVVKLASSLRGASAQMLASSRRRLWQARQ